MRKRLPGNTVKQKPVSDSGAGSLPGAARFAPPLCPDFGRKCVGVGYAQINLRYGKFFGKGESLPVYTRPADNPNLPIVPERIGTGVAQIGADSGTCGGKLPTTFSLPGSGRNFSGSESHVRLPIITGWPAVICLKCAKSSGRRQGRDPFAPIAPSLPCAQIKPIIFPAVMCLCVPNGGFIRKRGRESPGGADIPVKHGYRPFRR